MIKLNKEIFKFSENNIKRDILYENKLSEKITHCFNHLLTNKRIPINELKNDNTFDFNKLKISEGKNYDWFFLNNDKIIILIRQYQQHFTFFTKAKDYYEDRVNNFIIHFNREKITDDKLSDHFCDNPFLGLSVLLPGLIKLLVDNNVHSLWNNLSFIRPDYVDVKNVYNGGDDVSDLDSLLFACDELFNKYLECYAENEMIDKLKSFHVGDKFGKVYTIKEIKTDIKDEYYHNIGINFIQDGSTEIKWHDVYALTMWYYDALNYDGMVDLVQEFAYTNYQSVFDIVDDKKRRIVWDFYWNFIIELHKQFNETNKIDFDRFKSLIPKEFITFIEQLYYIKHKIK